MSEYQYLEFLAIDKPLTAKEMSALRALSTRADITPVSFINHYNWSGFQADPDKLMERHFDAYVYVADWLTAIFKVRLPLEALDKNMADIMIPFTSLIITGFSQAGAPLTLLGSSLF